MIPEHILDHEEQGLDRLIHQFRGKPRLEGWLRAYLRQCQLLEDAAYGVLLDRLLGRATAAQLDAIGRIVGEPRSDRTDAEFTIFIAARIRTNRSRGNTEDILEVIAIITTTSLFFREFRAACLFIEALTIMDRDPVLIYTILHAAKAAGVMLTLIVPTTNTIALRPMTYDGVSDPDHAVGDARALTTAYGLASDVITIRSSLGLNGDAEGLRVRAHYDTVSVTESLTASLTSFLLRRSHDDTISVTDSLTAILSTVSIARSHSDTVVVTDSFTHVMTPMKRLVGDGIFVTDEASHVSALARRPSETISASDVVAHDFAFGRTIPEAILATDDIDSELT